MPTKPPKSPSAASKIATLSDLIPDDRNANKGTERGSGFIENSLRAYGAGRSVLADKHGRLIAGNKTVEGCVNAGMERVRVVQTDGTELVVVQRMDLDLETDKAARELAIVDNRAGQVSLAWDVGELSALAADYEMDLNQLGFTGDELDKLQTDDLREKEVAEDEVPNAADVEKRCNPGDLWQLGKHRLLCGDSTKKENVHRLLVGAKPFIMVTDPPYGVEYDPEWRNDAAQAGSGMGAPGGRATGKVENDNRADWTEAYNLFPGDVAYVWHAALHAATVAVNLAHAKYEIRSQIVGAKPHFAISRGHYHWQHEPCWYAVKKGRTSKWVGDRKQSTLWEFPARIGAHGNKDDAVTNHSTQKPVECMARPIRNHGGKGDDVYEPFCGSGTTIVACEQLGRKCFALELSPTYCDIIIARWEKLTGKTAVRVD